MYYSFLILVILQNETLPDDHESVKLLVAAYTFNFLCYTAYIYIYIYIYMFHLIVYFFQIYESFTN